jgi:RNA polymerase sigma-70 factor (ECF subfamily)
LLVLSPEEIYERKLSKKELYAAFNSLPEKQAKRIYAYFFLGMSKAEIARIEGVSKPAVAHSIEQGLKSIEKFLKSFFKGVYFCQKNLLINRGTYTTPSSVL